MRDILSFLYDVGSIKMAFTVQQKDRGGSTPWPPRFPDLTPIDFFYWGYIQDIIYSTPVADLEDLHLKIIAACATVVIQEVHT